MNTSSTTRRRLALAALLGGSLLAHDPAAQLSVLKPGPETATSPSSIDGYGEAIAVGDFDGDGLDDAAVGAPFSSAGVPDVAVGAVTVNYGSRHGLTWFGAQSFDPTDFGGTPSQDAWFGAALAAADFDDDGYDDLAVGAPFSMVAGQERAGRVYVIGGSPNGLNPADVMIIEPDDLGALIEEDDRFGAALVAGRVGDTNTRPDLVIGSPGEDDFTGAIHLVKGGAFGLSTVTSEAYRPVDLGIALGPGDRFGYSLDIADLIGTDDVDVVVGAPFDDVFGVPNAGAIFIVRGDGNGLTTNVPVRLDMSDAGEAYEPWARFGLDVATGGFVDGTPHDLAVSMPGVDKVALWSFAFGGPQHFDTAQSNAGWEYGTSLAAGDYDDDGKDELAIGIPNTSSFGVDGAGGVHMLGVHPNGEDISINTLSVGIMSGVLVEDMEAGTAVAFGRFSDDDDGESLLVGAPGALEGHEGEVYNFAPWRQVTNLSCRTSISVSCDDDILFAQRPFDQVYIASTTKIMTTLVGCEALDRFALDPYHVELDDTYAVEAWMGDGYPPSTGCSVFGLVPGEVITFEAALRTCMMRSGNDSSFAIADMVTKDIDTWTGTASTAPSFVALMNQRAAEIGMQNTFFTNPAGVDPGDPYSCAYDMWLLTREAMQNELFADIAGTADWPYVRQLPGPVFQPVNVSFGFLDQIVSRVPSAIGVKGGSTPGASRTAVFAAKSNVVPFDTVYATGFGWPTTTERYDQGADLLNLALSDCTPSFAPPPPKPPVPPLAPNLPLASGISETLDFKLAELGHLGDTQIVVQPLDVGSARGTVEVRYDSSFVLEPGVISRVELRDAEEFLGGTLRNQSMTDTVVVDLISATAQQQLVLAPMQAYEFDVDNCLCQADVQMISSQTASIGLRLRASFEVAATNETPTVVGTISRDTSPWNEDLEVRLDGEGAVPVPVALFVQDAEQPFVYDPCTASWNNYGTGLGGKTVPDLFCSAAPAIGTTVDVALGPSVERGTTDGFLFIGFAPAALPTNKDGMLLVSPAQLFVLPGLPGDGIVVPFDVPLDPTLCGVSVFTQLVNPDPSAPKGFAFSRGMCMTFGNPDIAPQ